MHYLFPLIATSRDGDTVLLYGIEAFHAFVAGRHVGERFSTWTRSYSYVLHRYVTVERRNDWIVRDDRGRVVLPDAFADGRPVRWHHSSQGRYAYRNGPVPGIRHSYSRISHGARKRHGGRGVAARIAAFSSGAVDPHEE